MTLTGFQGTVKVIGRNIQNFDKKSKVLIYFWIAKCYYLCREKERRERYGT